MDEEKMYDKKFSHGDKSQNGTNHLLGIMSAWVKWTVWDSLKDNKKSADDFLDEYKAEDYKKLVEDIGLFDKVYKDNPIEIEKLRFWESEEFKKFTDKQNQQKCAYCEQSPASLKPFYKFVESDQWQRGQNFEIDRRHGRIKSYLGKAEQEIFIQTMRKKMSNINSSRNNGLLEKLKTALSPNSDPKGENYLYLPAPYNTDNCVFACFWCNNAKTDAFDNVQFKLIGLAMGAVIKNIVLEEETRKKQEREQKNIK